MIVCWCHHWALNSLLQALQCQLWGVVPMQEVCFAVVGRSGFPDCGSMPIRVGANAGPPKAYWCASKVLSCLVLLCTCLRRSCCRLTLSTCNSIIFSASACCWTLSKNCLCQHTASLISWSHLHSVLLGSCNAASGKGCVSII